MADGQKFLLLDRLDAMVSDLGAQLPLVLEHFDPEAIHKARVATRRLKAALDLLEPTLARDKVKPFARATRRLRRRLGPFRDLDVLISRLETMKSDARRGDAVTWALGAMRKEQERARKKARASRSSGKTVSRLASWWDLRPQIAEAQGAVSTLLASSLHLQLDRFVEQAQKIGRPRQRDADPLPFNTHQVRIAGKALRYTLEMAADEQRLPARLISTFKRLQDCLGDWHDQVVLVERLLELSTAQLLAHHDAPLQKQVLLLASGALEGSNQSLARFAKLWADRGENLARDIRARFPLTRDLAPLVDAPTKQAVNGSQTDHDRDGSSAPTIPADDHATLMKDS